MSAPAQARPVPSPPPARILCGHCKNRHHNVESVRVCSRSGETRLRAEYARKHESE